MVRRYRVWSREPLTNPSPCRKFWPMTSIIASEKRGTFKPAIGSNSLNSSTHILHRSDWRNLVHLFQWIKRIQRFGAGNWLGDRSYQVVRSRLQRGFLGRAKVRWTAAMMSESLAERKSLRWPLSHRCRLCSRSDPTAITCAAVGVCGLAHRRHGADCQVACIPLMLERDGIRFAHSLS